MGNEIPHKVRVAVRNRSMGRCEMCGEKPAEHMAHRIPRDVGGHSPANLLHICAKHHLWQHANPQESWRIGVTLPANRPRIINLGNVAAIPYLSNQGWMILTAISTGTSVVTNKYPISERQAVALMQEFGLLEEAT